jgi:hypothetical protein
MSLGVVATGRNSAAEKRAQREEWEALGSMRRDAQTQRG